LFWLKRAQSKGWSYAGRGTFNAFEAGCVMSTERESLGNVLARIDQRKLENERLLDAVHYQIVRTLEISDRSGEVLGERGLVWQDRVRRMRRFYRPATSEDPPQWFVDQFGGQNAIRGIVWTIPEPIVTAARGWPV
jgi:hypothetical protein